MSHSLSQTHTHIYIYIYIYTHTRARACTNHKIGDGIILVAYLSIFKMISSRQDLRDGGIALAYLASHLHWELCPSIVKGTPPLSQILSPSENPQHGSFLRQEHHRRHFVAEVAIASGHRCLPRDSAVLHGETLAPLHGIICNHGCSFETLTAICRTLSF